MGLGFQLSGNLGLEEPLPGLPKNVNESLFGCDHGFSATILHIFEVQVHYL